MPMDRAATPSGVASCGSCSGQNRPDNPITAVAASVSAVVAVPAPWREIAGLTSVEAGVQQRRADRRGHAGDRSRRPSPPAARRRRCTPPTISSTVPASSAARMLRQCQARALQRTARERLERRDEHRRQAQRDRSCRDGRADVRDADEPQQHVRRHHRAGTEQRRALAQQLSPAASSARITSASDAALSSLRSARTRCKLCGW